MFNADSLFLIGHSHKVCEDFTLHGKTLGPHVGTAYAMLMDGCSSSCTYGGMREPLNVDTGARLLAITLRNMLYKYGYDIPVGKSFEEIFSYAMSEAAHGSVPAEILDCTVGFCVVDKSFKDKHYIPDLPRFKVQLFGDGVIVAENENVVEVVIVEYESGAPYYLSYVADPNRHKQYDKKFGKGKKIVRRLFFEKTEDGLAFQEQVSEEEYPLYSGYFCSFPVTSVSIMSDGVLSFYGENGLVPIEELIPQLFPFKNKRGEFLHKKMNLFNRFVKETGIRHEDDFSWASIVWNPPNG